MCEIPDEYWTSVAVGGSDTTARKACYYRDLHSVSTGAGFIRSIVKDTESASSSISQLSLAVSELEASSDMRATILQLRPAGADVSTQEAKMYFKFMRDDGGSIPEYLAPLIAVLRRHGALNFQEIIEEIARRDEISPVSFVSLAFRPKLEIETYHDCEEAGMNFWTLGDVARIVYALTKNRSAAREAGKLVFAAQAPGFLCNHISCDLLGDDRDVSLAFDPDEGKVKPERFFEAIYAFGGLEISACKELLSYQERPALVSVKIGYDDEQAEVQAIYLEKSHFKVADFI